MIRSKYQETISPYYAASGPGLDLEWLDAVIDPLETRTWISLGIEAAARSPATREFNMGVLQTWGEPACRTWWPEAEAWPECGYEEV